jgi:Holliday junction DNA helicase RuvB
MEIIGHDNTKKQLEVAMMAAYKRNKALPHMLFSGSPGCGKTSMARYVARLFKVPFLSVVPNDLKDYKSVMKVLNQLNHHNYDDHGNRIGAISPTIMFLDEVHNLPLKGQELLGLAMERFIIESGRPNKYYWLPFFTLIGATTLPGKLSKPFRDRFKLSFVFQPYELKDMNKIVEYHSERIKIKIEPSAIEAISKKSRGIPRIAVGFVERIRDKVLAINAPWATKKLVDGVFIDMGIDEEGFTTTELKILKSLFDAGGVPVGLENLAIITEEDKKTIRDNVEPFLIRKGLILVSGKGRVLTPKGIEYIENSGKVDKPVKKEIDFDYERA